MGVRNSGFDDLPNKSPPARLGVLSSGLDLMVAAVFTSSPRDESVAAADLKASLLSLPSGCANNLPASGDVSDVLLMSCSGDLTGVMVFASSPRDLLK